MAVIDRERWQALEPLLDRALGLSSEAQAAWLDELTVSSPDLAAALGALLTGESDADRQGFLVKPLELRLAGLELGAYVLERPLGQGGMGSVWLARRVDGRFEGHVAIKLLNLSLLTTTGQERFRREGSALARLGHPGIARLLDAGVSSTGQPYLVLEYVNGIPIDSYAAIEQLKVGGRVELFLQVLAAVGHAHANLVVHRDLKPNNILVTCEGVVKLLDFGIAKLLDTEGTSERTITAEGGRALTPEFAAPEQVRGDTITTATDVYSLGTLLYLLVSGRHPTAEGCRTPAEAVRRLFEVEPARLGEGDLDNILSKALRKEASERYQTVTAFADDLEHYLRNEPVSARPQSLAYRGGKFLRRHRTGVAAAFFVVAALAGATVFSVRQMRDARRQRDAAVQDAKRSQVLVELQSVFAGDSRGPDGQPLSAVERIGVAERILTHQFRQEPWLVSEMMTNLSGRFYESGDRATQRQMLARSREIARNAGADPQVALAGCLRVYSFAFEDKLDSARADLADAKAALGRSENVDPVIRSRCLTGEGQLLVAEGKSNAGIALLKQAVALEVGDATESVATINDLAEALRLSSRMREAVPLQRLVLAKLDSNGYGDTDMLPNAASFLDGSLWELGEPAEEQAALQPFIREQEAIHGAGHVSTFLAFLYGQAKLRLTEYDSADVWISRAMRDTTQGAGGIAEWAPAVLTQIRIEQRRYDDAKRESAKLFDFPRGRGTNAALLKARIRWETGDKAGASALLEPVLRSVLSDGKPMITQFAIPLISAAEWRLAAGDARGADSLARLGRRAAAVDTLTLERSVFVGRAELLRARALRALGNAPAARISARQATIALTNGYGATNQWAMRARALRDSLEP
ncbi:MAG: serine/threonine-protein kinase [bacterium]